MIQAVLQQARRAEGWKAALIAAAVVAVIGSMAHNAMAQKELAGNGVVVGGAGKDAELAWTESAGSGVESRSALVPAMGAAIERLPVKTAPDPCHPEELLAAPRRPNWTIGAATTQCGNLETDYGWLDEPMGAGTSRRMLPVTARYGVTPRLELRWALPGPMTQSGGAPAALQGVTDQYVSADYRFEEQGRHVPAMALSYGIKVPTANPAKGFGTGYTDHQLLLVASRDVRRAHFDFNAAGILAGGPSGYDGALQMGLVVSMPVTKRLGWMVESVGGSQPGTADRLGQALGGVQWTVHPWLVLDGAYTQVYTAGTPRQQFTFGCTYSRRAGLVVPERSRLARRLAR